MPGLLHRRGLDRQDGPHVVQDHGAGDDHVVTGDVRRLHDHQVRATMEGKDVVEGAVVVLAWGQDGSVHGNDKVVLGLTAHQAGWLGEHLAILRGQEHNVRGLGVQDDLHLDRLSVA